MKTRTIIPVFIVTVVLGWGSGCARFQTWQMKQEVQEVAKRWCLTIRASQVIPVYPLTEDIQPGDVFLVQTPIPNQVKEYTKRGFLPLDLHLHRMGNLNYQKFYGAAYFKGDYGTGVPHDRPEPADVTADPDAPRFDFAPLPAAAFPDYTFEAKHGAGLRLAIPISGVPVGMGFLGSSTVNGSVKLKEAFTYGMDDMRMIEKVNAWARRPEVQAVLARTRSGTKNKLYLRVVSRVYLVGGVMVSLQAQGASTSGLDAGAAKPANPFTMTKEGADELKSVAESYKEAMETLGSALNDGLPGGSVRFVSANKSSVTMDEKFGRLLAIGYLGFDLEVDENGRLGAPVATADILEERPVSAGRLAPNLSKASRDVVELGVRDVYRVASDPKNQDPVLTEIKGQLDAFGDGLVIATNLPVYEAPQEGPTKVGLIHERVSGKRGYNRYEKYRSELSNTLRALDTKLETEAAKADLELIRKADAELTERFETSLEIALALRLYGKEVLQIQ